MGKTRNTGSEGKLGKVHRWARRGHRFGWVEFAATALAATAMQLVPSHAAAESARPTGAPRSLAASDELGQTLFEATKRSAQRGRAPQASVERPAPRPLGATVVDWLSIWGEIAETGKTGRPGL